MMWPVVKVLYWAGKIPASVWVDHEFMADNQAPVHLGPHRGLFPLWHCFRYPTMTLLGTNCGRSRGAVRLMRACLHAIVLRLVQAAPHGVVLVPDRSLDEGHACA